MIFYKINYTFKGSTMRLKKTLLLISTFSLFTIISGKSFASMDPQTVTQDADEKKEIESQKNNLAVDQNFTQGGVQYTLYKDLKAYVGKETKKNSSKSERSSTFGKSAELSLNESLGNGKKVLLDKGLFKIYEDNNDSHKQDEIQKHKSSNFNRSVVVESANNNEIKKYDYKVAYNNQSKKFGVITGNAIVKVDPAKDVKLPDSSFQIVKSYKNLGLYVVKLPQNIQFKDAINKLKNANPDNKIVSDEKKSLVNVEVLENFKSAM
jgi:ribosomal protein L9